MAASGLFAMAFLSLPLDRIPQILNVATELEFNLGTTPRINCAAAGNPFPVRGSMELRKPDGTMLLVSPCHPHLLSAPPPHQLGSSFLRPLTPSELVGPAHLPGHDLNGVGEPLRGMLLGLCSSNSQY